MEEKEKVPLKKRNTTKLDMCEGPVLPLLVKFAAPLLVTGVLQVLFNAADIMVIGNFGSDHSLAAVSATGALTALIVNLFVGLSVGSNVLCARFFGASDKKALSDTVHTSILFSVIIGALLTLVGVFMSEPMLAMMSVPTEVLPLAALYMRVYFLGMIPSLVYNFASAILRSVGDTKRPMYFLTLSGVLNVLLNLLLVIVFNMDVAGVAIATLVSQTVAATLTVICLMRESDDIRLIPKKLKISFRRFTQILSIGLPAGLHSTMFSLSNVVIQSSLNTFGADVIAGSGASGSIESLLFTALGSVSQAVVSFTGQNYGRHDFKRIRRAQLIGHAIVFTFGLALCALAVIFAEPLMSIYADNPAEIAAGVAKLRMIGIFVFVYASSDVAVAGMRGMGCSVAPTVTSLISVCGLRLFWIATVFQLPEYHNVAGLYASFPVSYVLSFIVQIACFILIFRKKSREYSLRASQAQR
ncbi:MAG: MATE family efflux transporter [Clostridia bacterium]|nr:MATE family efflux transporter [Clostridia bacterium]